MFTGLIEDLGTIYGIENQGQEQLLRIRCSFDMQAVLLGDSIAVNGVCLTVTEKTQIHQKAGTFAVQVSAETQKQTTFATLTAGANVNLERALAFGGRLNGHLVQGHVDAIGQVERMIPRGGSIEIWFQIPAALGRYLLNKGSVAVDGVSLTVNTVVDAGAFTRFSVNIIPHTQKKTTLANLIVGRHVNIETDFLSRTVERLLQQGNERENCPAKGIDELYLRTKGF